MDDIDTLESFSFDLLDEVSDSDIDKTMKDILDEYQPQQKSVFTVPDLHGRDIPVKFDPREVLYECHSQNLIAYYSNNEIIGRHIHIKTVGINFRPKGNQILEDLKYNFTPEDILIILEREPNNQHDKNAIMVHVGVKTSSKKYHIGYIPKTSSEFYSYIMDSGKYDIRAVKAKVVGGEGSTSYGLHFVVRIMYK
jgi:hypothetical protein